MSGPKTSRYTLTAEQRRILAKQREIERRKNIALESIKRNKKELLQIGNMFSVAKQLSLELTKRTGNDGGFAERLLALENVVSSIDPIIAKSDKSDVTSLELTSKYMADSLAKAQKISSELSTIASKNEVKLYTSLNTDIDKGFETSFADITPISHHDITDSKVKICEQLSQFKNKKILPTELIGELEKTISRIKAINDETFLKNFFSVTVTPLIKRCEQYFIEFETYHEEFEELYTEYIVLCNLSYRVVQEYSCCADSIATLKAEIERMKIAIAEDDEQTYISNCLDEVMEEMGYTVIGSREIAKKSGKHFRNELYTYGEGTAVNVTYSSDGKIAMEIGGIDTVDRLPNSNEASVLCKSMQQFCDDFEEIEKRLLAKGVVPSDRISLLPPSAEYAQIINTTDYQMEKETDRLQSKRQHRAAKMKKTMEME